MENRAEDFRLTETIISQAIDQISEALHGLDKVTEDSLDFAVDHWLEKQEPRPSAIVGDTVRGRLKKIYKIQDNRSEEQAA